MINPNSVFFKSGNDNNVIHFPGNQPPSDENKNTKKPPPLFNIPTATKILVALILVIQSITTLTDFFISPLIRIMFLYYGAFLPVHWTDPDRFGVGDVITPLSYALLHGGWMHTAINAVMLVALGSGIERSLGIKRFMFLFWGSSVIAAFTHLAFSPFSDIPVIGASGGIGGLFGAMLVMMRSTAPLSNPWQGIMPIIIVFVLISAFTGMMGAPDGSSVAWIAHIGGFLGGIGLFLYGERRHT